MLRKGFIEASLSIPNAAPAFIPCLVVYAPHGLCLQLPTGLAGEFRQDPGIQRYNLSQVNAAGCCGVGSQCPAGGLENPAQLENQDP